MKRRGGERPQSSTEDRPRLEEMNVEVLSQGSVCTVSSCKYRRPVTASHRAYAWNALLNTQSTAGSTSKQLLLDKDTVT